MAPEQGPLGGENIKEAPEEETYVRGLWTRGGLCLR